jgi:fatty acid desaturase
MGFSLEVRLLLYRLILAIGFVGALITFAVLKTGLVVWFETYGFWAMAAGGLGVVFTCLSVASLFDKQEAQRRRWPD